MRSLLRALAVASLAVSLFAVASAEPFTGRLDDLKTFLTTARNAIPASAPLDDLRQRNALTKALAAFNANSRSLDGDVRMFGRVAAAIQGAAVLDSATALQNAIFALAQDVSPERDALAARIDLLVATKLTASAQKNLADINASLNSSVAGAGSFSLRAKDLRFAIATIASTNARITKSTTPRGSPARPGVGYFAALVDGVGFVPTFGSGRVTLLDGVPSEVTLTGYSAPASKGGIEFQWSAGSFTGPGDYLLDGTSGLLVVLIKGGQTFFSVGGTVTVTGFDLITRRVEGTFNAQFSSNSSGDLAVTKGIFDVRRFATPLAVQ